MIELLTVIAIVGTLAALAIPNFFRYREKAAYSKIISEMRTISVMIEEFNISNNRLPNDLNEVGLGGLTDYWGNPYQYLNISLEKGKGKLRKDHALVPVNTDYDLYSMGPDGDSKPPFTAKASRDDIVRANNGSYYGTVADY